MRSWALASRDQIVGLLIPSVRGRDKARVPKLTLARSSFLQGLKRQKSEKAVAREVKVGRDIGRCQEIGRGLQPANTALIRPRCYTASMSTLYIVATPIGNLSDASGRSIEVLGAVDGILAEDTRRTRKLLDRYDLRTSLTSLHGHNETSRIPRVVTRLDAGESLALVSDAGTPLLSDPGERLVRAVLDAGHTVTPVPGPSAILSALMGAGFATVPFIFHGFVPRKGKPRQVMLEQIASAPETSVVFESPERVATLLRALVALVADDRQVVVAREMTKIHEEFFRGTMAGAARYYAENKARGEVTVVVSPRSPAEGMAEVRESVDKVAARALARALVDEGLNLSRAAREVSSRLGIAKNAAYEIVHSLEGDSEEELG